MDGNGKMINELLLQERSDGILGITMNNPDKLNALSESMIDALKEALDEAAEASDTKCIVLRGAGRAFCAGHDLKELAAARNGPDRGHAYFKMIFDKCAALMMSIVRHPQPVIAEVHGAAVAAGCQLVATCDMAVAAERARFGVNGVDIGLFCSTPMVALSRNVSRKRAFEMLTTGRLADAREALDLGLVNKVVADDSLARETRELASLVASKLGAAVKNRKAGVLRASAHASGRRVSLCGRGHGGKLAVPRHGRRHFCISGEASPRHGAAIRAAKAAEKNPKVRKSR